MDPIARHLDHLHARIAAAARHSGRDPATVTLVGVTKHQPASVVARAIAAGLRHLGENRVQDAEEKLTLLSAAHPGVTWHLIGHLQRNKARRAAALFDVVQSLDSLRLAEALDRYVGAPDGAAGDPGALTATPRRRPSGASQPRLPILLQVNVSGEPGKEGFDLPGGADNTAQLPLFLDQVGAILALPHLQVAGLMTIAPWGEDPEQARPTFRALRQLRDDLARRFPQGRWSELSMGMSDDFSIAVEEGATIVRIGRAIFGERP